MSSSFILKYGQTVIIPGKVRWGFRDSEGGVEIVIASNGEEIPNPQRTGRIEHWEAFSFGIYEVLQGSNPKPLKDYLN